MSGIDRRTGPAMSRSSGRQPLATRLVFFAVGLGMSSWAPLVPYAKQRLAIDDAWVGLLLLCLGAGSIISMPMTGPLIERQGCRVMILWAGAVMLAALPVLAFAPGFRPMAIALFLFGGAIGTIDVAINVQAVIVEKARGVAMMSGFHGLFSVGGIVGAGGLSVLLGLGITPLASAAGIALLLMVLFAVSAPDLVERGSEFDASVPRFVLPHGRVILIGILCFICFLAEGAMLDWSAIFLNSLRGFEQAYGGIGYAAFALAMTFGRLTGDRIITRAGRSRVLLAGSICAAVGFLIPAISATAALAILGFVLVGLGAANIVPILFTAAGTQSVTSPARAVAAVTTLGYTGILTGPALIGLVSEVTNLRVSFAMLAAMVASIAWGSRWVTSRDRR
jgi:predicted MFS family arabinose efflux permease